MKAEDLKFVVQERYGEIAKQSKIQNETTCCGVGSSCCTIDYAVFAESYNKEKGYNPDADLGLGCGIPTQFASIKTGDAVLDLGSGAGNDCFVVRAIVGETGKVTGIDFTDAMLEKARKNNDKLGFTNVEFVKGDIEAMPLAENQFDVIVSNCVLNLVPDKRKAFAEMMRVLKSGGHFCVSDVVIKGELPANLQKDAEMYAGCVSGAVEINEYLNIIKDAGFKNLKIHKKKDIVIPEEILKNYMDSNQLEMFRNGENGIYSITISADKEL
jgi:ubiquinone/menaquinone biosynthesis C-methylase UbiE